LIEYDLGEARKGLELNAIDAIDASAPDDAEDQFRASGLALANIAGASGSQLLGIVCSGLPSHANLLLSRGQSRRHPRRLGWRPRGGSKGKRLSERKLTCFGGQKQRNGRQEQDPARDWA
jgi:hypothetical protein